MRTMINLLPIVYRQQQVVRQRTKQWAAVISIMLLIGWLFHLREVSEQSARAQRVEVLEREHQPTQTLLQQLVDMRQKLVDLQKQEVIATELEHQRNALALLGVISKAAEATGGRLRVTSMELSNFQSPHTATGAGGATGQPGKLQLNGVSLDSPAVFELLDGLQNSGMFSRVILNMLKEREGHQLALRDYEVSCEF
jgi:hypothetical protein